MTLPSSPHLNVLTGAKFSTYRIGGPLEQVEQPETTDDAIQALEQAKKQDQPVTIIGWGSNSVISTQGILGLTLITRNLTETLVNPETGEVFFGAGVFLGKASTQLQKARLGGAAFWVGIPGTIGGAVRMNAGAMGSETARHLTTVQIYNLETTQLENWRPEHCQFSYRHSAIDPKKHLVLGASFRFNPLITEEEVAALTRQMDENITFRRQHHPSKPNGGSVFQNPYPDHPVGRLLDELGARAQGKSWQEGDVRISHKHANFIVNLGHGTSTDLLRLMARMKREIHARYGFNIHPENIYLGEPSPEEQDLLTELRG